MAATPRILTAAIGLAAALTLLAGCSTATPESAEDTTGQAGDAALDVPALAAMDVVDMIDLLESMPVADRPTDLTASVRSDEVVLTDAAGAETTVATPAGQFHLSVAPYVDHTHDCYFHSLTTCSGELGDTAVDVRIVDVATGEVLVSETTQTFDNGYVAYWVPDDVELDVTISSDGRTGSARVTTGVEDLTCLTTLQLT